MNESNSPPSIALSTLPRGIGKTLARREIVYSYLRSHYTPQVEDKEHIHSGVVYYHIADLSNLLEQSGMGSSQRSGLERELQERRIPTGYAGREAFVRLLEQQGCFKKVYSYCRNNLE